MRKNVFRNTCELQIYRVCIYVRSHQTLWSNRKSGLLVVLGARPRRRLVELGARPRGRLVEVGARPRGRLVEVGARLRGRLVELATSVIKAERHRGQGIFKV